ncbi:MAG: DNA polymerase III, subunit gamma and tau [Omnitrophica WOR_2 bacterium RIFCSPLOWO2_12_FULL_51_8]|nr:MAG: DNA polymerase III, subunit gamma and tau [Omnitrophica WOR_2 bacterium RIFCSPLOWO2_12_FULL_51_8]
MPYTVFALKWRPNNFEEVIGQDHITLTLKSAIQKSRLAHAYLFTGPRGVGKTSTARILAKALNCQNGPTVNPCQNCPSCLGIGRGNSLDVLEIDGASNRGIDEIRTLRENVKFAPVQGNFKIYIIDEVHQITTDGFNALLKTLEEPPEYVKFIFATTHPHKVIPTILSRCQRFDFRRIPALEIAAQLGRIAAAEKIAIDKEVLFAIARAADGSLRDAESVLDQLFSFSKEKISLKDVVSVLGIVEQEALFAIADKIIQKDPNGALSLFNQIIDQGKDAGVFLSSLIEHFRNLMVAKVSRADAKLIDLPQEACEKLFSQSNAFTLEEIFSAFNILVNTQEMAKRLDSLRIPLEISLVRLSYGRKDQPAPLAQPKLRSGPAAAPPAPAKTPPQPSKDLRQGEPPRPNEDIRNSLSGVSLEHVKQRWQNIVDNLSRVKISAAAYLSEGEPFKVQGNVLTVSFPKNYSLHKESLEARDNRAIIEKSVSDLLNVNLRVNFILSEELKQGEDDRNNSFIKTALEMFDGRVIREE